MRRLNNKTAIVTGAAHGLGKAISELFAAEGAAVFMLDSVEAGEDLVSAIRKRSGEAAFIRTDLASADEVGRAVRRVGETAGRIDVLCNAAVEEGRGHSAFEAGISEWERWLSLALLGAQHAVHEVLPFMIRQKGGSIINLSSVHGLVARRNAAAEMTARSGLLGFTRSLACDYGAFNIRVNALCPGAIEGVGEPTADNGRTFLARTGQAHEVAAAALFLASDDASFVTGAVLPVDGGWTAG